jgi:hypothetical protein
LQIVKGDKELLRIIHDNLGKLKEQPYVALKDDLAMDEGLRKEFAFNLGVYYYALWKNFTSQPNYSLISITSFRIPKRCGISLLPP